MAHRPAALSSALSGRQRKQISSYRQRIAEGWIGAGIRPVIVRDTTRDVAPFITRNGSTVPV